MSLCQETRSGIFFAILVGNMCFLVLIGASLRKNQGLSRTATPRTAKPSAALTQPQAEREGVAWTVRRLAQFLRSSGAVVSDEMHMQPGVRDRPVYDFIKAGKVVLQLIQFDSPQKAQDFAKDRKGGECFVWGWFAVVGEKSEVEAARKALVKKEEDESD